MISPTPSYAVNYRVRTKSTGPKAAEQHKVEPQSSSLVRTAVALEFASLRYQGHCPLGMYVTPSNESLLVWDAVFFVHKGYYADSILKFTITFPLNYPERQPSVKFLTDVFHPLIAQQTREFSLSPRFRPWRPKEHHVFDILHWIKASFKKQALDGLKDVDCLNKEAYRLYHGNTSSFAALAQQSSQLSQTPSTLYDTSVGEKGKGGIVFREMKRDQLAEARNAMGLQAWDAKTES